MGVFAMEPMVLEEAARGLENGALNATLERSEQNAHINITVLPLSWICSVEAAATAREMPAINAQT